MGWEGEPVDSWVHAFRDATKDDGEGNYNINDPAYAQWNTIEKTAWNQEEHYPDKSIDGEAMPSNAYHRVDLVHRPTPQISVEQRQVGDDATCTTDRHPNLNTGLGRAFLGETNLVIKDGDATFSSPLAGFLEIWRLSNIEGEDTYSKSVPFPFGLPVVQHRTAYCMHIQPERRFKTKIDTLSINHELVDTEVVFGEDYYISVLNTIGSGVFGTEDTIPVITSPSKSKMSLSILRMV